MEGPEDTETAVEAVTLVSLLREYRDGRNPYVDYRSAYQCLKATGHPLSQGAVRDLQVPTVTLNNRAVGRLDDFIREAGAYIERRQSRPNLKALAAAKARTAKRQPRPSRADQPAA